MGDLEPANRFGNVGA